MAVSQELQPPLSAATRDFPFLFAAASVNTPTPPQIDPLPDRDVTEESTLSFAVVARDADQPPQKLTFSLGAGALTGASLNPTNGLFTWTPTEGQGPGTNLFGVIVTDDGSPSLSVTQRFTVVVREANRSPIIPPIPDQTVNEGDFVLASVLADDPDLPLQPLTFGLLEAPPGASINASGLFTWTPDETQGPGTSRIVVVASDDGSPSLSATQQFTVIVREANRPPVLAAVPEQSVNEEELLAFTVVATDPDVPAQQLTFSLSSGAETGATIDPATGMFQWMPTEAQGPGSYFFGIVVTDSGSPALSESQGFIVMVREVNGPPALPVIAGQTINEGESIALSIPATDADAPSQTLTFSLGSGAPNGASLSEGGFFFWTPSEVQGPSTNELTIVVRDSGSPALSATQVLAIIVREVNLAPSLGALLDRTTNEGESLTFTAQAADTDLPAQTLAFTLGPGAPDGAAIDRQTGAFSWTPTEGQGPGTYQIAVVVTDSGTPAASASQSFAVTVREVNRAPVLPLLPDQIGNPGVLLVVSVPGSDPDLPLQTLLYSLAPGAPVGANITTGGLFTWAPTPSQSFTTNRITVVANDGSLSATQSFTVVVLDGAIASPRLRNPVFATNTFTASVDSLVGRRYFLERSRALSPPTWQTVGEFQGTGGAVQLLDRGATNPACAYRVRVQ